MLESDSPRSLTCARAHLFESDVLGEVLKYLSLESLIMITKTHKQWHQSRIIPLMIAQLSDRIRLNFNKPNVFEGIMKWSYTPNICRLRLRIKHDHHLSIIDHVPNLQDLELSFSSENLYKCHN